MYHIFKNITISFFTVKEIVTLKILSRCVLGIKEKEFPHFFTQQKVSRLCPETFENRKQDYAFFAREAILSFQDTHNSGARQSEENKPASIPIIMGSAKERIESS